MFRKATIVVVVLLVVAGGGVYYLLSSLDGIVARVIESTGTAVTGTSVGVSGVEISLRDARGSIRGLRIGNPEGFSGEAISLRDITIALDPSSLAAADPIILTRVRVQEPVVHLVLGADGRSNLQALQKRVDQSKAAGPSAGSEGSATRIRIERLEIDDARLEADLSAIGGKSYQTTLPALHRSNVGGASGSSPNAIGHFIVSAFIDEVIAAVARSEAKHEIDKLIDAKLGGETGKAAKGLVGELLGR